jgi:acetyl esterase/lipase
VERDPREVLTRPAPPPPALLRYGDGADQVADAWPGGDGPCVLFLHGGFWRSAYDRAHARPLCHALRAEGFPVMSIEYVRTGAPGGGWPGTFDDVRRALRELPAQWGHPPSEVVLAGHSAGGHLALWGAAELARAGAPPRGVLGLAAVSDLTASYDLDLDGGAVTALLGGAPAAVAERYLAADPLGRLPVGVPVALVHGTEDAQVPVDFSRRFTAAASAAGDQVTYRELVGVEHFAVIDPESAAWPSVIEALRTVSLPSRR